MVLLNFCLLLAVFTANLADAKSISPRIINGEIANGTYPYMVQLQSPALGKPGYSKMCTSTIISKRCLLTAGHCVVDHDTGIITPDDSVMAFIGSKTPRYGAAYQSSQVIPHEKYAPQISSLYDIALVVLDEDIDPADGTPIAIATSSPADGYAGKTVLDLGWGVTETGKASDVLRQGYLTLRNRYICAALEDGGMSRASRLCVDIKSGRHVTEVGHGDSGGPIILEKGGDMVEIGVVSLDVDYSWRHPITGEVYKKVRNDVFTDVGYFYPWIKENCMDFQD